MMKDFLSLGTCYLKDDNHKFTSKNGESVEMSLLQYEPKNILYFNTIVCLNELLKLDLDNRSCKVILHIHELKMMLSRFDRENKLGNIAARVDRIFVPCSAVRTHLVNERGISHERIVIIKNFLPATLFAYYNCNKPTVTNSRSNKLILIGVGTLDWRKGADLFLSVAKHVAQKLTFQDVEFRWFGGETTQGQKAELDYDIKMAGLLNYVKINYSSDIQEIYSEAHLLLLTSREDPFPTVVLEAAIFGLPTLAFEGAGGIRDFIKDDAGWFVGYRDVERMGEMVLSFHVDRRAELSLRGAAARRRLLSDYTSDKTLSEFWSSLNLAVD